MIAIDLSKQQAFVAESKPVQQIDFTGNLNRREDVNDNATIFFITEKGKETILDFSQENGRVL